MTALPSEVDGVSTIKVQGGEVQVDRGQLIVDEASIDEEMDQVAALISFWGEMWAAAEQELMEADAHYRHWRAKLGEEMLEGAAKVPAEWKVKQAIEANPKFVEIKRRLALAKRNAITLQKHMEAFAEKGDVLKTKGAMRQAKFETIDASARQAIETEDPAAVESGKAAMKKTFKS